MKEESNITKQNANYKINTKTALPLAAEEAEADAAKAVVPKLKADEKEEIKKKSIMISSDESEEEEGDDDET